MMMKTAQRMALVVGMVSAFAVSAAAQGPGMTGQGQMGPGQHMGQGPAARERPGPGQQEPGTGPGEMGPGMGYGWGPGMMMGPMMMGPGMMGYSWGPGMMMRPGMMGPMMMGPGMMGYGWGPRMMMGPGWRRGMMRWGGTLSLAEDLKVADVRRMMEWRLAWRGNPNLKLGKVEEKDKDTIVAEIVTKDGSLVRRFEIDRHTGLMRPVG